MGTKILIFFMCLLVSSEETWVEGVCALIFDEHAMKGKVTKCVTAEQFFQDQLNEELSRVPNYKTMIDATIDWERLIQYATFREGFVLSIEVTHKRGFVFECQKFLAKEINEPYSWKGPWINEEKKAGLQQYLYIGKNSMPVGKEIVFFIDPACCDNFPTASLSCAFKLIPINLLNEMATTCTKYYSSQVMPANKSMQRTLTACSLCSPAGSRR